MNRTKEQLIEIYGEENVREVKGRLQVQEEHFQRPGGRLVEWVEADNALPPAEPSDPVPEMTEEDYEEEEEEEEEEEDSE